MIHDTPNDPMNWTRRVREHVFSTVPGDWTAMEALLDNDRDPVSATLPTDPAALDARWPFPFFTGLLISVIVLAFGGLGTGDDLTFRTPRTARTATGSPAGIPAQADLPAAEPLAEADHVPAAVPTIPPAVPHQPGQAFSFRSPGNEADSPAVASPATKPGGVSTLNRSTPGAARPPGIAFHTLAESEYTPGLMAVSRLIDPIDEVDREAAAVLPEGIRPPLPRPVRWHWGLLAGLRMAVPDWPARSLQPGAQAGAYMEYGLAPRWSLRAELLVRTLDRSLVRERSDEYMDPFGSTEKVDQQASANGLVFLDLPVLLVRRSGRHEVFAGPRLSRVWVSGNSQRIIQSGSAFVEAQRLDITDGVRAWDAGVILGYGYRLSRHWTLDARLNQGLLDLTHDRFFSNNRTLLSSDASLSVRYGF